MKVFNLMASVQRECDPSSITKVSVHDSKSDALNALDTFRKDNEGTFGVHAWVEQLCLCGAVCYYEREQRTGRCTLCHAKEKR